MIQIDAQEESWPLKEPFRIARGTSTEVRAVVVTASDGHHIGRGEAVPIKRYNQTVAGVLAQIGSLTIKAEFNRRDVQALLPPGPARNAVDCALWDLEAKIARKRIWKLAKIPINGTVSTALTLSLDTPEAMATSAAANPNAPILKLKLGGDQLDVRRVAAVRKVAPRARLLIDANESWSTRHYQEVVPALKQLGVELVEQPFPAGSDEVLESLPRPIPVCADESCHISLDLPHLTHRYDILNIKLDKTGGLTEALVLASRARQAGFKLLVGCMVCTSLAIAPARVLASLTDYADLDGPLLLARDRENGLAYRDGTINLPSQDFWG